MLERDGASKYLALSVDEAVEALWAAYQFEETSNLRFDVFSDMLKLLRGDDDSTTCIWNACDPWTTPAVQGIGAQGERYLCQHVNKDGRPFIDAPSGPLERPLVLASTSQDEGGCQGCRFLAMCKGNCPGTAIDGDWRKRTVDCELWFRLFERLEAQLVAAGEQPVSRRPDPARAAGIPDENIILDPGVGFGKTVEQNLELVNRLDEIRKLCFPILLGVSRKSFIGYTLDLSPDQRLEGTAAAVAVGIVRGADIVRIHDIPAMVRVARMTDAVVRRPLAE